ncbi:MAG: hypothetical protein VCA55_09645 [Verrucomicrobiales bacterium]
MVIKFPLFTTLLALIASIAGAGQGLILQFGDADSRIARQVALYVPEGRPASQFTNPGQLKALWQGTLNLEARSRLIFTLEGTGQATLTVDGEVLCTEIGTPSERKRLGSGRHAIQIQYKGPTEGHSQLRLFWEGRDFGREPIPATAFSHAQTGTLLARQGQPRAGHRLIKKHGCRNCHGGNHNPEAPSLEDIGKRLEPSWLAHWIENPAACRPGTHMPKLFTGAGAAQKAADIAHFLAPPREKARQPATDPQEIVSGGHIFYQQGCIGCHTLEAKGSDGRIGLGAAATKYRPSALAGFLREPAKHHDAARMPDFGFSAAESKALESFLRTLTKDKLPARNEGNPERGKLLLKQSGCLNCHAAGKMKTELPVPKALATLKTADCKAANYLLTETEQEAITVALNSPVKPHHIPAEFAQQQFITLRCAACHDRDGQQAYREIFQVEISHLKPPDPPVDDEKPGAHKGTIPHLNHLGSKLRPEWSTRLFAGQIQPKTRHWLKARMPAFASRAGDLASGFSHAAGLPEKSPAFPAADPEKIKTGADLAGITGFSCGACHAVNDKPAFAVFEGEGPNLKDAGARLRNEYFHLWMNSPMRQWPGTIMPAYAAEGKTPLAQHYEGDAKKQFEAIYQYLISLVR